MVALQCTSVVAFIWNLNAHHNLTAEMLTVFLVVSCLFVSDMETGELITAVPSLHYNIDVNSTFMSDENFSTVVCCHVTFPLYWIECSYAEARMAWLIFALCDSDLFSSYKMKLRQDLTTISTVIMFI